MGGGGREGGGGAGRAGAGGAGGQVKGEGSGGSAGGAGGADTPDHPAACGNRIVEVGEQCDMGTDNGRYIDAGAAKCVLCDVDCLLVLERCYWPGEFPTPSTP